MAKKEEVVEVNCSKRIEYHRPQDARELGWMGMVFYTDKDGMHKLINPWEVRFDISLEERELLHKFGEILEQSFHEFARKEGKRIAKLNAKAKSEFKPVKARAKKVKAKKVAKIQKKGRK